MDKKKRIERKVRRILDKQNLIYIYKGEKHFYDKYIQVCNNAIYIKLFYKEDFIEYENVRFVYISAISWLNKLGYCFSDLEEYKDNHEICLTFLKNE